MSIKINNTIVNSVLYDGKRYYQIYLNGTRVSSGLPMGTVTLTLEWGYEDTERGAGCDNDQYYYPKNPVVTVQVDGVDLEDYKLQLSFYNIQSDCFQSTQTDNTLINSITSGETYSVTLQGAKSWSNGDSASAYAYMDAYLTVRITDNKTGVGGTATWGSVSSPLTFHCDYNSKTYKYTGSATAV